MEDEPKKDEEEEPTKDRELETPEEEDYPFTHEVERYQPLPSLLPPRYVLPGIYRSTFGYMGMLATAILVVNNLRDRTTDARVGKRTLVVRFGARFARFEYALMVGGSYACILVAVLFGSAPTSWLLVALTLPLAIIELKKISTIDGVELNPMLGSTARLELVFALTLSVGALWAQ